MSATRRSAAIGARVLVALVALAAVLRGTARADAPAADAVALLPLDADRSLEIYGQPVASEIARALAAGNVQVVVVGPRMAVPERARLIIDGTIALGKSSAVTLSLRIRNTADGLVLDTFSATAPGLAQIDAAAAELSARALPIVLGRLAALRPRSSDSQERGRVPPAEPAVPVADKLVLVAVADAGRAASRAPLVAALESAVADWARVHRRTPRRTAPARLAPQLAAKTLAGAGAELAFAFTVLGYSAETGVPPMARARVRVQIWNATGVVFDRVVATDTVLGDRASPPAELAGRVAREVLAILRPHLRRSVPSWP